MTDIKKIVPAFDLALGEEDGMLFGAVCWPTDLGPVPYTTPINICFGESGFVLKGENGEHPIEFQGVAEETLWDLEKRVIVIIERLGDEIEQYPVEHGWERHCI